jgi:hypothetical protein
VPARALAGALVAAALLAAGCGGGMAPSDDGTACMTGGEPGPLLVEERTERPQVPPYARRVTEDGTFWELSAVRVTVEGGETRFEPQPLRWRARWSVPPADLERIRAEIRASGILDAPERIAPQGTSIGGSDVTWTVCLDGRTHSVLLHGAPDARHEATDRLKRVLDRALQAGADAARPSGGG